jgi:hypothetical protein
VEINPDETDVSRFVEHRLRARAGEALSALWERMSY